MSWTPSDWPSYGDSLVVVSARRLYLLNIGLAGLGMAALGAAFVVAFTRLRPGTPSLDAFAAACREVLPASGPASILVGVMLVAGVCVGTRGAFSVFRRVRAQRSFLNRLSLSGTAVIGGRSVQVVEATAPAAFCGGLSRPRIYVSDSAIAMLGDDELNAVVAHEAHHQGNRDPLRLLIAGALADALFFLPSLRRLSARYAELAELAADEAAASKTDRRALASALLTLGERGSSAPLVGIGGERVDQLLGTRHRWNISTSDIAESLTLSALLLGLSGVGATIVQDGTIGLPALLADACMTLMVLAPLAVIGVFLTALSRRGPRSP